MAWARIDDGMADHPKIVNAENEAVGAWARMICFCSEHATDGKLTRAEAMHYAQRRSVIARLLEVRLLDADGEGYRVHDFADYNPTGEEAARAAATRKDRARKGASAMWGRRRAKEAADALVEEPVSDDGLGEVGAVPVAAPTAATAPGPLTASAPRRAPVRAQAAAAPPASTRASLVAHCRTLIATPERAGTAGVVGQDLLASKVASLATESAARSKAPLDDPAVYATKACDVFAAYQKSCTPGKRPHWRPDALETHWGHIGRILLGVEPQPVEWTAVGEAKAKTAGSFGRPEPTGRRHKTAEETALERAAAMPKAPEPMPPEAAAAMAAFLSRTAAPADQA